MILVYKLFIALFSVGLRVSSLWNVKAKQWLRGRIDLFSFLESSVHPQDSVIWIHSASAGEFEQAKPVIEQLKQLYPTHKIAASIFSPSGYSAAKNNKEIDFLFYLPLDTRKKAKRLVSVLHPDLVIFVKYDYWYYHLREIHRQQIPLLLISSIFRPHQTFFKTYGGFYKKMLFFFTHIFVQDEESMQLLNKINVRHASVAGDTRFDRVMKIARQFKDIPYIERFIKQQPVLIAGSTWPDDEQLIKQLSAAFPFLKLIIAPHEINEAHLSQLRKEFPEAVFYSKLSGLENLNDPAVLIIDNVGMLSRLYKYATITYVGGGFTKDGIHNTLEAAVFGKPVLFGPNYNRYREAIALLKAGGAFSITAKEELKALTEALLHNENAYQQGCNAAENYVKSEAGATQKILDYIQENRLLTN